MTYPVFVPEPPEVVYVAQAISSGDDQAAATATNPLHSEIAAFLAQPPSPAPALQLCGLIDCDSSTAPPPASSAAWDLLPPLPQILSPQPTQQEWSPDFMAQRREPSPYPPSPTINPNSQPELTLPAPQVPAPPAPTLPAPQAPAPLAPQSLPGQPPNPSQGQPPLDQFGIVELMADHQDYDQFRQIVTAEGNVFLRFREGQLQSDFMQFNTNTQVMMAKGHVQFLRGRQRLEGEFLEYNLVQEVGQIEPAAGEVLSSTSGPDLDFEQPTSVPLANINQDPVNTANRVDVMVISTGFGTSFGSQDAGTGNPGSEVQLPLEVSTFRQEGTIKHWRFKADRADLLPEGWNAYNVQMTNDPFSPPQFEIRAREARYRELGPLLSELRADQPRYVLDRSVSLPTFRNRVLFDRRPQDAGLFTIGFDNEDRGGLFIERSFEPISRDHFRLGFTPQLLVQKAFTQEGGNIFTPEAFALKGDLAANIRPGTSISGSIVATDLGSLFGGLGSNDKNNNNSDEFDENLRGNVRASQILPWQHTLNLESSFRDRLFNGSLGFQTVQRSLGAVLVSPDWRLGNTGIVLNYQTGLQYINADTDRSNLLDPIRDNNRVNLTRYQASARLSRGFTLWQGKALPATPDAGLRYTAASITPSILASLSTTGIYSGYSSGDGQDSLTSTVGVVGTFGHFSRPWFDYTRLNVSYSHAIRGSKSPFLFDRINDTRVISFGITQQLYGPIRFGFQTSRNLDTNDPFSVDYTLEYSRRAFDFALRFNPELEIGSLLFRINDFEWQGRPADF